MAFFNAAPFNGIHPADEKSATRYKPVEHLTTKDGDEFYLFLSQHIGAPAQCIVKKGQSVLAGELIATASGFISANIHSPVDGIVQSIDLSADHPVSGKAPCIVIKAVEQSGEYMRIDREITNIADVAKVAGIVGLGGAMFPAHVKLSPKNQLDTLIVNGAECEPFLTCDHRQMLERTWDLVQGALLIKDALKLKEVIFAIETNKRDAIRSIESMAGNKARVQPLHQIYPQGGEKQQIFTVTGREVPEGKLPSDINIILHNVSTVLALRDAIVDRKPLISRVITISGGVREPKNILVPLGTPISRLVEACGGIKSSRRGRKIIIGGPMTGCTAQSLNIPSYKGMNGIVALREPLFEPKTQPCVRCGRCIEACPQNLSPLMLESYARNSMLEDLHSHRLLSCIECGACSYACPSKRPLKNLFKLAKPAVMGYAKNLSV
ncbi:Na+-translocating ferredoxin:NAD+ oxidoreductase RNF, RnfC subunit [Deferribacterales bacterium RsTz2092]|nr:electron transport complex subunit C [Deferribacterales bacterium]